MTAAIAILILAPVGIGIAVFLTEFCTRDLRRPIGAVVELAAGVPSVIYGIWGLFVLAPLMEHYVEPAFIGLSPCSTSCSPGRPMASAC